MFQCHGWMGSFETVRQPSTLVSALQALLPDPVDVLAIAAHCDDVSGHAAGLLQKIAQRGPRELMRSLVPFPEQISLSS